MSTRERIPATSSAPGQLGPDDPRYRAVIDKQFNKRFRAHPDHVWLVGSTEQVVDALQAAVNEGRRVVVTSGGHCLEGFVSDPDVRVIINVSPMNRVYHDRALQAVAVEAGATVGETLRALSENWGTMLPLGEYPGIGMGGHVVGGAFGFFCRQFGLAADHLYAVEVVTVDADGRAHSRVATREPSDPHHDLWWAHTGAGGGNLGIVTRYWFRSPDASAGDTSRMLPRAPESVTTLKAEWNWSDIDRARFMRLVRNHGTWSEQNADAASPHVSLWALLQLHRQQLGKIILRGVSTAGDAAESQIDAFVATLSDGVGAPAAQSRARMSWLEFALNPLPDLFTFPPGGVCMKGKDALLKRRLTDRQIGLAFDHLTRTDHDVMGLMLALASYGGRVNTVLPGATASVHRGAILDMAVTSGWLDPAETETQLKWVRAFYRELFADTGGAPVPGDAYEGAMINHPDPDLADPVLNTSGVPWHAFYYQDNYPRLQRVKARWDPRNVFRHALSIRAK